MSVEYDWRGKWPLLEALVDYILFFNKGDIIEVGVLHGNSSVILSCLAQKYDRFIYHCDIRPVRVPIYKKASLFIEGSDKFFEEVKFTPIVATFLDGDHSYKQVKRDFENALKLTVPNGYIFLHDTYPPNPGALQERRCGTSYILRQELEKREDLDCSTFVHTANNCGLTCVRKKPDNLPHFRS